MEFYFGVDYYPEHWPRERWETDAKLMQEMGIDLVRMAEFSWKKMEPRMGEFHFDWLEDAVNLLGRYGIRTVLGTPTAAPPAWIVEETPEILPMDSHGIRHGFGGRHHDCQSNLIYRSHIHRFVQAMAERFQNNKNVVGWQPDNELGNSHQDFCMCDSCTARFQSWLKEKYQDIDTLNREWGTCFWSQEYDSFNQIPAPKVTASGQNPSAMLDWKRFCSDLIVDFQQHQIDILRRVCPDHFITHNFMGFADKVNYFDLAENLDFISHDQYPGGHFAEMPHQPNEQLAASLDLMRGIKAQTFWIMEQQAGITGWEIMGRSPHPGQLSAWAMQSVAHGADAVVFFRWRTCTVGTEQYWHGVLPHNGKPGRRYKELKELIQKMRPVMKDIQGQKPKSDVAIVFSYDQEYALQIQPHHPDLNYVSQLIQYYKPLYQKNVPVDFISDKMDFGQYSLIIAPLQYIMTPQLEEKYRQYVQDGGHLVLTMRTGVKNYNNVCMSDRELPGALGDLLGLVIEDYDCLRDTEITVDWDGEVFSASKWSDMVTLAGAEPLALYSTEYYAGSPAVTEHASGKGVSYYVASEPGDKLAERLCAYFLSQAGIQGIAETPDGVEIAHRKGADKIWYFVINHTEMQQAVVLPNDWKPVFAGQESVLEPFAVHIYEKNTDEF